MKKLLVTLVLVVILSVAFTAPVFAGQPEDKPVPGNMPDGAEDALTDIVTWEQGTPIHHMRVAFVAICWGNNSQAAWHAWGIWQNTALNQLRYLLGQ